MRSSVVLPDPLRPATVSRSPRSTLNETSRSSGAPATSFPSSEAIATAMRPNVGGSGRGRSEETEQALEHEVGLLLDGEVARARDVLDLKVVGVAGVVAVEAGGEQV